jgi:hypothetical protein
MNKKKFAVAASCGKGQSWTFEASYAFESGKIIFLALAAIGIRGLAYLSSSQLHHNVEQWRSSDFSSI